MCYNPDEGEDELDNLTSMQEALIRIQLKEYILPFLDIKSQQVGKGLLPEDCP